MTPHSDLYFDLRAALTVYCERDTEIVRACLAHAHDREWSRAGVCAAQITLGWRALRICEDALALGLDIDHA